MGKHSLYSMNILYISIVVFVLQLSGWWSLTAYKAAMSSTSQKHKDFVAEPMGEKAVNALAGIGEVLGKRLEDKGFDKVMEIWFLCLLCNINLFGTYHTSKMHCLLRVLCWYSHLHLCLEINLTKRWIKIKNTADYYLSKVIIFPSAIVALLYQSNIQFPGHVVNFKWRKIHCVKAVWTSIR